MPVSAKDVQSLEKDNKLAGENLKYRETPATSDSKSSQGSYFYFANVAWGINKLTSRAMII